VVKAFIVDWQYDRGRRRVSAVIQWGGTESLNPRDIGMKEVNSIVLSAQTLGPSNVRMAIPMGSAYLRLGSPSNQGRVRGGIGSTVLLRWWAGSTGTRAGIINQGTVSAGTKTAHAWIHGI